MGANLGDAVAAVRSALARLAVLPQSTLVKASSLYRTAPHEAQGPDFINAVAQLETQLQAHDLLAQLQAIEAEAGRERPYPNAPRTLDLDLLLYGADTIRTARLAVPHPRMNERAFVLVPLAEIAPALVPADRLQAVAHQRIEPLPPA
ncbi:2-amino-4-hydroxy-6-hydroxymethyldihydropteridine diphosphokinase [Ramlibacter sp. PS4R-6]|uniref:2-amino-4-hydroxy-6- hydroxymethyldihydropteridine diphosphokinase n=1 Tax=Ramlibacter sp. PS4R-6 TaxID=3133438 RepID=UPI0030B2FB85